VNISSVRLGFNTSSSSNHSLILNTKMKAKPPKDGGYYGWDRFVLKSRESKEHYLAVQLYCNLYKALLNHDYAIHIVNGLFGKPLLSTSGETWYNIDHSSVLNLPTIRKPKFFYRENKKDYYDELNLEFYNDLKNYILNNDNLAILGGNDNQEYGPLSGTMDKKYDDIRWRFMDPIARKDGDYWVIFNKYNGTKIRLSFVTDQPFEQASLPESVDLKITDFCPYNCKLCYQDSSLKGHFGSLEDIKRITDIFEHMGVFEVSIGGGEPTTHPFLYEILMNFSNTIPNLTTRSIDWIHNTKLSEIIKESVGGLALSCDGYDDEKIRKLLSWKYINDFKGELSVHMILEGDDFYIRRLIEMFKDEPISFTLLGFKGTGRAIKTKPTRANLESIFETAEKCDVRLGLDVKAIADYEEEIRKFKISELLMEKEEGKFSMYVDTVTKYISKDSYTTPVEERYNFNMTDDRDELYFTNVVNKRFPFC
jgi:MoaA/NifB/PqqE/SkfB family radical SAM enzyme